MNAYWAANWPIWVSAFCVLAVYTYLFKDNPLYRIMMQIFIGVNLGYQAIIQWRDVLYPQWWLPMLDGFRALFGGPGSPWGALWAIVGLIGLLFYLQLSRKYASYSKIAIGITIGIGAGLTFKSQFGQNLPQVLDSFKPLAPPIVRPQPRVVAWLPGSERPPALDGSLVILVSGRTAVAAETFGGMEIWRSRLELEPSASPSVVGEEVRIPCGSRTVILSRSDGSMLRTSPSPKVEVTNDLPTRTMAVYRQPQFSHGVEIRAENRGVGAYALRNGVAEGVKLGDQLWTASFPEPVTSVQSFDGVMLVSGRQSTVLWDIPAPQAKLTPKDYFDNWVSVATVICVMSYFFFSFRRRGPAVETASKLGRWVLMIGFGAFFGNTVMTRMSFLLDRLMFLIDDWLRPFFIALFHR